MYRVLVTGFLSGRNGVSSSMMNLYRNIDKSKVQWDFVMFKDFKKQDKGKSGTFENEILASGGKIYFMKYDHYDFPKHSRKLLKEIMLNDKDIMGVHCHVLGRNIYPMYLAHKLDLPIKIMHFHSGCAKSQSVKFLDPTNIDEDIRKRLKAISGEEYDRWACSDLGGVIQYRGLVPYEIFPNAVDTEKFSFNPIYRMTIRNMLGIPQDAIVFGFMATLYHIKNPLFAIKVVENFRKMYGDAYMILAGAGGMYSELKTYVEKHHLKRRVLLLGQQLETDMYYSAFDLFLCPSLSEGLPNTLAEAQASGCQCLISDEITDMAKITSLVESESLKKNAKQWASKANEMLQKAQPRRSWSKEIKAAGYDIKDAGERLTNHYLERIENWRKKHE